MAYRTNEFEDRFYDGASRGPRSSYHDVGVMDRERQSDRLGFLRQDRQNEAGPLVLRKREVESSEHARPRRYSPSPPPRTEHMSMTRSRARSVTPPHPSTYRDRDPYYERSPSPVRSRYERPPPAEQERERIRIIKRERERQREPEPEPEPCPPSPEPSPSPPPPPPPVIRGPTIEREVITHYRDIDHGVTKVPQPCPPPPPAPRPAPRPKTRTEERQLDIDIRTGRRGTDVDVRESTSRSRGREPSQERRSPHVHAQGNELVLSTDRDRTRLEDRHWHSPPHHHHHHHRRSQSAAPVRSPIDEEAEYITNRINSRGRHGEAWHGATKDWEIVDVPPGTERVRMDGVGGGSAEVDWTRYSGVRRAKFIPERDGAMVPAAPPRESNDRVSSTGGSSSYERELEIEIDRTRQRPPQPPPKPKQSEMWTEITKDLCVRDAIRECGYEYEETEQFFYVMQYLKYDQVLELIQISDDIRRYRRDKEKRRQWEREWDDYYSQHPRHRHPEERISEREFIYDHTRGWPRPR